MAARFAPPIFLPSPWPVSGDAGLPKSMPLTEWFDLFCPPLSAMWNHPPAPQPAVLSRKFLSQARVVHEIFAHCQNVMPPKVRNRFNECAPCAKVCNQDQKRVFLLGKIQLF